MEYYCQHCNQFTTGSAYRVTSEEFGVLMLDMIVCYECSLDARRLGLHTDKFKLRDAAGESHPDV
jgi:hypothetical protein